MARSKAVGIRVDSPKIHSRQKALFSSPPLFIYHRKDSQRRAIIFEGKVMIKRQRAAGGGNPVNRRHRSRHRRTMKPSMQCNERGQRPARPPCTSGRRRAPLMDDDKNGQNARVQKNIKRTGRLQGGDAAASATSQRRTAELLRRRPAKERRKMKRKITER